MLRCISNPQTPDPLVAFITCTSHVQRFFVQFAVGQMTIENESVTLLGFDDELQMGENGVPTTIIAV